ncbi:MAG: O-antigen ligase family protein, partial [Planctomycetota bacterium]
RRVKQQQLEIRTFVGSPPVFWDNPDPLRDGFGPFVNKNNAAGYLCACLAAVAGILSKQREDKWRRSSTPVANSKQAAWWILNMLVVSLLVAGVLFTLSRGAFLALIVGIVAISPLIVGSLRSIAAITAGLASTMLLIYLTGMHSGIVERMMKIDTSELQLMRGLHWQDDLSMIGDMWISGCGFGAYRFVNRVYQTVPTDLWFMYSENQYLETLASGGILLLGTLIVGIVACFWRAWQLGQSEIQQFKSLGIMGVALITMQIVAASFDFALFHSSNLILVMCMIGVVLGSHRSLNSLPVTQSTAAGCLILLIFLGGIATREAFAHAGIERAMSNNAYRTFSPGSNSPVSLAILDEEIERLAAALELCPDHPTGHARLADMYLRRSRVRIYEQLSQQVDKQSAWVLTSPEYLASRFHANDDPVVLDDAVAADLKAAEHHFLSSNWSCPLLPRVHYRLGLIQSILSDQPKDPLTGVKDCLSLVKMHSKLHLSGGSVAILTKDDEQAATWLRRGLVLGGEMSPGMLYLISREWSIDRFIERVLGEDIEVTWQFLRSSRSNEAWRNALCQHLIQLVGNTPNGEGLSPAFRCYLADAHAMLGNTEEAEKLYRSTFEKIARTDLIEFRFSFAKLLYRKGRFGEAFEHTESCLEEMPWHKGAAGLREQLAKQLRTGVTTRQ